MRRVTTVLLALVVVVATFPVAGTVGVGGGAVAQTAQSAESDIAPGQQFAGVVGVQGAEVRNEIEDRALATRLATAGTNATRAEVVARESVRIDGRLDTLEDRRGDLRDRREDGEITRGTYSAELAEITAEATALERRAGTLLTTARALPNATLDATGVSVADVLDLRDRADSLTDDEALAAAREVAGDDVGEDLDEEDGDDVDDGDDADGGEGSGDADDNDEGDTDSGDPTGTEETETGSSTDSDSTESSDSDGSDSENTDSDGTDSTETDGDAGDSTDSDAD
jgi:hypothetical protein